MSGDYTGTLIDPAPRRGTVAKAVGTGNVGTLIDPAPRRGTVAKAVAVTPTSWHIGSLRFGSTGPGW